MTSATAFTRHTLHGLAAAAVLSLVVLGGCGELGPGTDTAAPGSTTRQTAVPSGPASPSSTVKINANTATLDDLTAAFTTAGIATPDRWAKAVVGNRPYTGTDGWSALRQAMDKDNIDDATFTKITSLLVAS